MSNSRRMRLTRGDDEHARQWAESAVAQGRQVFTEPPHPIDGIHISQINRTQAEPISFVLRNRRALTIINIEWDSLTDMTARPGSFVVPDYLANVLMSVVGMVDYPGEPPMTEQIGWIEAGRAVTFPVIVTAGQRGYRVPFRELAAPELLKRQI